MSIRSSNINNKYGSQSCYTVAIRKEGSIIDLNDNPFPPRYFNRLQYRLLIIIFQSCFCICSIFQYIYKIVLDKVIVYVIKQ